MNAHIALRVSTAAQAARGVSLGRDEHDPGFQEEKCRQLCSLRDWTVAGVYRDAATGRKMDKLDGLMQAAAAARADGPNGMLVFFSVSRCGRSTREILNLTHSLHEAKANFASATEQIDTSTAMGNAFFQLIAVFAELESRQIGERTRHAHRFIKGRSGFGVAGFQAYGWRMTKVYEGGRVVRHLRLEHDKEQAVLARIGGMLRDGARWKLIANTLNALGIHCPRVGRMLERGLTPPEGLVWTNSTVRRVWLNHQRVLKEMGLVGGAPEAPLAVPSDQ